ncbi:hypothetical protein [Nocardiopsis sp. CNT312]|uniref:hypothetical protein n=1 Tax=Nocardiopsis sp. CNT312 TaxID=1137268 RepID=UPI0012DF2683|nr:hypothetical protein [Nocardiopsis sp. CNT312]
MKSSAKAHLRWAAVAAAAGAAGWVLVIWVRWAGWAHGVRAGAADTFWSASARGLLDG